MLCLDGTKYEFKGRDAEGRYHFRRKSKSYEYIIVDEVRYFKDGHVTQMINVENPSRKDVNTY